MLRPSFPARFLPALGLAFCTLLLPVRGAETWALPLPARPADAPGGRVFAESLIGLTLAERDEKILTEVLRGNVPDSWRNFAPVVVEGQGKDGRPHRLTLTVAPDYLSVGTDADGFLTPLAPGAAQRLADRLGCQLPTPRLVQAIWQAAPVKLPPSPLPPGPDMTTVPDFLAHNERVRELRRMVSDPPGVLTAGGKKDIVLTRKLAGLRDKVAIFGWHRPDGTVIQPLYTGHTARWVDYSHGVRLVRRAVELDGHETTTQAVLADPDTAPLLSGEGPLLQTRLDTRVPESPRPFGEDERPVPVGPGVRAVLNLPAGRDAARPLRLLIYAVPNGNTIAQTLGRRCLPGDDWHFGIQHTAAQVRWLRAHDPATDLALAVVECDGLSWPAWRKREDPENIRIPEIVQTLTDALPGRKPRIVLAGHSGGGAFLFGVLEGKGGLPAAVERLVFLDANYAWDAARGHPGILAGWLEASPEHSLCVVAYHDSAALLNGKPFVSEAGGTWGRSHAMLADLGMRFPFTQGTAGDITTASALGGRVGFWLHGNPERRILHTVLVERNGLIHGVLAGTAGDATAAVPFFSAPVYASWIADD